MIETYCYIENNFPLTLKSITDSLFYDEINQKFYKLSFMPDVVAFQANTVSSKYITTITKVDPLFVAINSFQNKNILAQSSIPHYLSSFDWCLIATRINKQSGYFLEFNEEKVFDWLEIKADRLNKELLESSMIKNLIAKQSINAQKQLNEEVLLILKCQLPEQLILKFAQARYKIIEKTKRMLDCYDENETEMVHRKELKSKSISKKEEKKEVVGKDQSSLLKFFQKK